MNPKIFANPARINLFTSTLPHIEPAFGKHAGERSQEDAAADREQFIGANRQILPGFGKHRANRYSSSYRVVEGAA